MIENPLLSPELRGTDPVDLISKVITTLINLAFVIGIVIFFFMLVTGGIQWIASGGDKGALANARSRIVHAIVGLLILLSVYAIVTIIEQAFGINILLINTDFLGPSGGTAS